MLDGCVAWPPELAERYRRCGYWRGERLGDLLRGPAREDPDRLALTAGGRRLSYGELDLAADRFAAGLRALGVEPLDRVVVQLPNVPEFVTVLVGCFRAGALPVLALPAHRRSEISYLCRHADAAAYVIPDVAGGFDHRALAAEVREAVPGLGHVIVAGDAGEFLPLGSVAAEPERLDPPDPGEVAFFLLSGGTTGLPKLIPRTHDDYAYQIRATAEAMGMTGDGTYLAALPVAHNAALGSPGLLGTLRAGGHVVLASSPSPDEVFGLIARERVSLTTLMPAFLSLWAETAELFEADLSGVVIEVGGAPLTPEAAARGEEALGCRLTRWFGMAEGLLCFTRLDDERDARLATEGQPLCPDDELRVVDAGDHEVAPGEIGELLVRGPYTLRGYYRAAEHNRRVFTPDGYLRTGDLVRFDEAGRLVVEGRIKDVVNRAGEKVPAEEVEACLRRHPLVRDVAVVGLPDPGLGERTCAVVVAAGGEPGLDELRALCTSEGLADYKRPDRLRVVDGLPRTSLGKVDKVALRRLIESGG